MNRLFFTIALLFVFFSKLAVSAPSCFDASKELVPCYIYLETGTNPTQKCCQGMQKVSSMAPTKEDRVAICHCFKRNLATVIIYDPKILAALPQKCGVDYNMPPIDRKYDCNQASVN